MNPAGSCRQHVQARAGGILAIQRACRQAHRGQRAEQAGRRLPADDAFPDQPQPAEQDEAVDDFPAFAAELAFLKVFF